MASTMKNLLFTIVLLLGQIVMGLTPAEWRRESIYFLLTDRFAREDNSVTASCNTENRVSTPIQRPALKLWSKWLITTFRCIAVEAGRVLSIAYVSKYTFTSRLLTWLPVGLYPRHGLYCHLDYSSDKATIAEYWLWNGIPWILATRYVRLLNYQQWNIADQPS